MGDKPLVFHEEALAELNPAISWYFEEKPNRSNQIRTGNRRCRCTDSGDTDPLACW
jgi:hypothetical protein